MPDSRYYLIRYSKYFKIEAPESRAQALLLLLMGALAGIAAKTILTAHRLVNFQGIILYGLSTGLLSISLPALLTVMLIKSMKRNMLLKHAFVATLLITPVYALFFVTNAAVFSIFRDLSLVSLLLVLSNAGIYGYWFVMGRVVIGRGKSAPFAAAIQPILNVLLYLPAERYILAFGVPLDVILLKLLVGMVVFLAAGYLFLYLVDRASKKLLDTSAVGLMISLLSQWLYNLNMETRVLGERVGVKRKLEMDVLALKGKKGIKAVFVNPDIHFGPFGGVGGSVAPALLGSAIVRRFGAAPVVLHAPLDLQENPISTSQVQDIVKRAEAAISSGLRFEEARGSVGFCEESGCKATEIALGRVGLLLLTRAPNVTEDMGRRVGQHLRAVAQDEARSVREFILIDAHNSRLESASGSELGGVGWNSRYARSYEGAVRRVVRQRRSKPLRFGTAYLDLSKVIKKPDIGQGYASVSIFGFGSDGFCLVYFDANNMLPRLRSAIVDHVRRKTGFDAEVCTTDTHAINALNMGAVNSLGRYTSADELLPVVDQLLGKAMSDIEPARYCYKKAEIEGFAVWGENAEALIKKAAGEARKILKYVLPFIVAAAFIVAAWLIYIV